MDAKENQATPQAAFGFPDKQREPIISFRGIIALFWRERFWQQEEIPVAESVYCC
ncbi:MAG: hypothetical protein ACI4HQ_07830 [Acetatifactor sp.]